MISQHLELKEKAVNLRQSGCTYGEILNLLGKAIPKSTLSYWCKDIILSNEQKEHIKKVIVNNIEKSRKLALLANKQKREAHLRLIRDRVVHLKGLTENIDVAKSLLAMLYVAEGSKSHRGTVDFGNSDPYIVQLFIYLLKKCYLIDQSKFRIAVQCRADQNIEFLEDFWSEITSVSQLQFYKTVVDPRSIGKPSRKKEYKGVCRIYYFSADVDLELKEVFKIITGR